MLEPYQRGLRLKLTADTGVKITTQKWVEKLKQQAQKDLRTCMGGQSTWRVIHHKKDTISFPLLEKQDSIELGLLPHLFTLTTIQTKVPMLLGHTSGTTGNTILWKRKNSVKQMLENSY